MSRKRILSCQHPYFSKSTCTESLSHHVNIPILWSLHSKKTQIIMSTSQFFKVYTARKVISSCQYPYFGKLTCQGNVSYHVNIPILVSQLVQKLILSHHVNIPILWSLHSKKTQIIMSTSQFFKVYMARKVISSCQYPHFGKLTCQENLFHHVNIPILVSQLVQKVNLIMSTFLF